MIEDLPSAAKAAPLDCTNNGTAEQAVTKLLLGAEINLFRPLKRAGDVLTFRRPQSYDWGYPMPPAHAG
jgi:hypothetical protein